MLEALLKLLGLRRKQPDPMQQANGDVPAPIAPVAPPQPVPIAYPDPGALLATPKPSKPKRKTLAGVVGVAVAGALLTAVPMEESGRAVEVVIDEADNSAQITHIKGKQYLKAYLDIVGVATACDGITRYKGKPIKIGDNFAEAQCTEMLEDELIVHAEGVMKCSPTLALSDDPYKEAEREGPRFAAVSFAYNVGVAGFCGSSVNRNFRAWDYTAGCNALMAWNKGRVKGVLRPIEGLTARRKREKKVCLEGL
jgi:lysozyme